MVQEKRTAKIGDAAPDFRLRDLDGGEVRLSRFRGKRVLLFAWATWCPCREQLASWQAFYEKHRSERFELIGVAMDVQRTKVVRPMIERARVKFPIVLDMAGSFWDLYGFSYIPNGYYVDERGQLRYLKLGGFDIRESLTSKIIEDLLAEKWSKVPVRTDKVKLSFKKEITELKKQSVTRGRGLEKRLLLASLLLETDQYKKAAKEYDSLLAQYPKSARGFFGRGTVSLRERKKARALEFWRTAFALDPSNWVVRKQIWSLAHPEQFYPRINLSWQNEQIRKEETRGFQHLKPKARAQRK